MNKISIENYKPIGKNGLKCVFDLKLNQTSMILRGCSLFEKDGKRWINLPQKVYEVEGKKKYTAIVEIQDKALRERFQKSAKEALFAFVGGLNGQ